MVLYTLPRILKSFRTVTFTAVAATAACADAIPIVDSTAPLWGDSPPWTIATKPTVIAGNGDADAGVLATATDAARTEAGRLVIAVPGAGQIRIYDPAGRLYTTVGDGRSNAFAAIAALWIQAPDTIAVGSMANPRVDWFDADGNRIGGVTMEADTSMRSVAPIGVFDDGSLLARAVLPGPITPDGARLQDSVSFLRVSADGHDSRAVARMAAPARLAFDAGTGKRQIYVPFALTPSAAPRDSLLLVGNGERAELAVIDPNGHTIRLFRWARARSPVTADVERHYRSASIGESPPAGVADAFDRFVAAAGFPDSIPSWNALRVDEDGFLWLRDYQPPWALDQPQTWTVLDPDGRWLGSMAMPAGFTPVQIGRGFMVGTLDTGFGTRQVAMFVLDRQPVQHVP